MAVPKSRTIEANLAHLVDHWRRTLGDDCWPWPYGVTASGYGGAVLKRRMASAHRVVYEMDVGLIPSGLVLDHLCRNRRCVNPAHLEPVTQKVNVQRKVPSNSRRPRKTHCKFGHAYDEANTGYQANGAQRCRMCSRLKARRRVGFMGIGANHEKTHCKYGHPLSGDNLILQSRPSRGAEAVERVCRTCAREHSREMRAKKQAS